MQKVIKEPTVAKLYIFLLLQEADKANYIMGAAVIGGTTDIYNRCGLRNNHAFTILSAFTMTDA